MSLDKVTNTEVERVDLNALGSPEASWGQAAPPSDSVATWLVGLLQAGDSFYPTGSYAHSFGLEGLVQEGAVCDRETLRTFIFQSMLPSLQRVDLPLAAHAWRAFGASDWKRIGDLCVLSASLKAAQELRAASSNIGRQRAELVAMLQSHALATEYLRRAAESAWPLSSAVSAALEGRVHGAPLPAVLAGVYYANVASLLSAAMKVLRLGQNASQSLLAEALSKAPVIITVAEKLPVEEIGWFNPWLDIAAARHETADSRMFIS